MLQRASGGDARRNLYGYDTSVSKWDSTTVN